MQKRLYNGKTQKEWFEQLSESISILNLSFNDGNIQDKHKEKEIVFYFNNNDNLLSENKVNVLIEYKNRDKMSYDYLKKKSLILVMTGKKIILQLIQKAYVNYCSLWIEKIFYQPLKI